MLQVSNAGRSIALRAAKLYGRDDGIDSVRQALKAGDVEFTEEELQAWADIELTEEKIKAFDDTPKQLPQNLAHLAPKPPLTNHTAQAPRYDVYLRKFQAVMYLVGAGQRQMARMYGVSAPTISNKIARELRHIPNFTQQRLRTDQPSAECFDWLAEKYYSMIQLADKMDHMQLATLVLRMREAYESGLGQREEMGDYVKR